MYRYVVPIDDEEFSLELRGPVLFLSSSNDLNLDLFVLEDDELVPFRQTFRIFNNGEPIFGYIYIASVLVGKTAKHLFRYVEQEVDTWQPSMTGEPAQSAELPDSLTLEKSTATEQNPS